MYFNVLPNGTRAPGDARSKAYLLTDNWNDWWEFQTLYSLIVFDDEGERHSVGGVKIGQFGMTKGQTRPAIPDRFEALEAPFFSLGQDDSYYDDLNTAGPDIRDKVLRGLRDIALNAELFDRALDERVTAQSLLRFVTKATATGQFRRMANGGVRLSRYEFNYAAAPPARRRIDPLSLSFVVEPESFPPTNIHVLIGRNGVGKTTILNNMTRAIVDNDADEAEVGAFSTEADNDVNEPEITNLVSVTFSAFDPFEPLPARRDKSEGVQYAYIGLKHMTSNEDGTPRPPKTPDALSTDFGNSVLICRQGARAGRWKRALEMLEADPIFRDAEVAGLSELEGEPKEIRAAARRLFKKLSSGHKIVLLTITRLVETVEEKTIVVIDEPEVHLHPPLLSAFVRALSDLLINRNGMALIATHSPVVLQEVPMSCVWKVRRTGARSVAERPDIETFGENVGILTREVFGLEVTHSGFHKMLRDAVAEDPDFNAVLARFGGELGEKRGPLCARSSPRRVPLSMMKTIFDADAGTADPHCARHV